MRATAIALAFVALSLAGCAADGKESTWASFTSGSDHFWLAGNAEGKTEFSTYNWTNAHESVQLEWRAELASGQVSITVWDSTHNVVYARHFTRLSDPSAIDSVRGVPGKWVVGVGWGGITGEYSFEGRAAPVLP